MMTMKTWKQNKRWFRQALWAYNAPEDGDVGGGGGGGTSTEAPPVESDFDAAAAAAKAVASHEPIEVPKIEWDKFVSAELREKPWMKSILEDKDPTTRFLKEMDGLQSKLGAPREGLPKPDSPKEEWDKFYTAMGRPESPDGYEVPKTEWPEDMKDVGDFIDSTQVNNEAYVKVLREVAHDLGIPKEKFAAAYHKLNIGFVEANKTFFEEAAAAKAQADVDYAQEMVKKFGQNAEKVQDTASRIMVSALGEDGKKAAAAMSAQELARLAFVLNDVQKKYIGEDVLNRDGSTTTAMSEADRRKEGMRLMVHPAYEDFQHPEHESVQAQVRALYGLKN